MGRYHEIEVDSSVQIDLMDYVDDFAEMYQKYPEAKSVINELIFFNKEGFLNLLKKIRKDSLAWEGIKYDILEIVKEDAVIV